MGTQIALLLGIIAWLLLFVPLAKTNVAAYLTVGSWGWIGLPVILCLALAGASWRPLREWTSQRAPADFRVSCAAALIAGAYLGVAARQQHRQFFPYVHDESSYLIQAHQLAHGRWCYPAHPLGLSFDSFQLLTRGPVYASAYFPGTALLHVPGVWLGSPPFVTTLLAAAAVAGLLHWLTSVCLDRIAGHLAVLLLLACPMFRTLSTMTMTQIPLLLYALAATAAWLRWFRAGRWPWALACGLLLGFAAITRPVDALCFAVPIGIGSLRVRRRALLVGGAAIICGLLPAVAMQATCNHAITGQWTTTPFRVYADADHPGTAYGFHRFDRSARPDSTLQQKQVLYFSEYRSLIAGHQPGRIWRSLVRRRLPLLLSAGGAVTPFPLLAAFWPAGWAACTRRVPLRGMLLAVVPFFLLAYIPYVFFFPDYTLVAVPGLIVGVVLASRELAGTRITTFATLAVGLFAVAALPQFDPAVNDDLFNAPLLRDVDQQLAGIHHPAVVLFQYDPHRNVHEEPVYNTDVAWPDDAFIIRAHDLGPVQNAKLLRYYAALSPGRAVYRYDEATRTLSPLGTVFAPSAAIIR